MGPSRLPLARDERPSPEGETIMSLSQDRDSYTVFDWMWQAGGLGLKPCSPELAIYARIYGVSNHGLGASCLSQESLARTLGLRRETVSRKLQELSSAGLVVEVGQGYDARSDKKQTKPIKLWMVAQAPINTAIRETSAIDNQENLTCLLYEDAVTDPAEKRSVSDSHKSPEGFQQSAEKRSVSDSHKSPEICERQSHSSLHKSQISEVVENSSTCGNSESPRKQPPPSTREYAEETAGRENQRSAYITSSSTSSSSEEAMKKSNKDKGAVSRKLSSDEQRALDRLVSQSLKPVEPRWMGEVRKAFVDLVDKGGVSPDAILAAYDAHRRAYLAGTVLFTPSLSHWLMKALSERGDSARGLSTASAPQRPTHPSVFRTVEGDWCASGPGLSGAVYLPVAGSSTEEEARASLATLIGGED